MNLLSEHNRILRVGEGGSQEYFAGPNINITDHVISGKYWDNEINSAISSTSGDIVNEAFNQSTAWTEEQGYLTAHQDVSNLPYVQNSALEFSPQGLISGISGSGIYATSAEGALNAETANFAYNAEHADSADYAENVYSAQFANSASSALNSEVANVAYTALTSQFLDGGWEHDEDGFITAYNNSAFAGNGGGGGGRYDGISPIVVNNEEMRISAKSALLGVQGPLYFVEDSETATVIGIHDSAFPTFEGTPEGKISAINGSALNADPVIDYSAGNNIDITDHVISVTGSVQSADRADYAVSATSSNFSHSAIEAASANSATYDNLGREIIATYLTAVTGDNTPYSAGTNINITNHIVSGKDWTTEIQAASANAVDQIPTGLMVTSGLEYDPDNHYITAYNGSAIGKEETEYSAGANININNHVISGKDWSTEISAASSYAYEQSTGTIPDVTNLPYVQNTALSVDGNNNLTAISSYNVGHPQVPVSGESGVYLTKRDGTVYIGYSGSAQSAEYEGVAPIVVNNVEHKISAQSAILGVQEPLYFVEDSVSATIIGFSGSSDFPESADQACQVVTANSANWNDAYNSARSGYAASAYLKNYVTANVSNWNGCRTTVYNNSAKWGDIPTKVVANSGLATGSNILYIVTGS